MTANPLPAEAVPCPACGYDLRGQVEPACPECGRQFPSFEALRHASAEASRVFVRVLRWRQWIALSILGGMWGGGLFPISAMGRNPLAFIGVLAGVAALFLLFAASCMALLLLLQVIRWRFSPLITSVHRRELTGSIVVLLFFCVPAGLLLFIMVMLLLA